MQALSLIMPLILMMSDNKAWFHCSYKFIYNYDKLISLFSNIAPAKHLPQLHWYKHTCGDSGLMFEWFHHPFFFTVHETPLPTTVDPSLDLGHE